MDLPTIDENLSTPKSVQIFNWYEHRISSGELETGQKLPSIRTLASSTGTSTTTVKRALDSLQNSGYLEKDENGKLEVATSYAASQTQQARWQAFWSYAHEDERNTHGAVSQLMQRICDEFAATTSEPLGIFQDAKDIPWGSNWRQVIEKNVTTTVFFIPILTPTYLHRPNCISEFSAAITNLSEAGISNGIFPIVFIDISTALRGFTNKQLKQYIEEHQYIDCTALRRIDPDSTEYKFKVGEIVDTMVSLQDQLNKNQDKLDSQTETEALSENDGYLEQVQMLEDSVPVIQSVSLGLCNDLDLIGSAFKKSSEKMNVKTKGSPATAAKILACRQLANEIKSPVENFNKHCNEFVEGVHRFDAGISALPKLIDLSSEESDRVQAATSLNNMIDGMQGSSKPMFSVLRVFRETLDKVKDISRDLRPVLASLQESCEVILELEPIFDSWSSIKVNSQ
ncbi:GntR family transcriptional regulator [Olsenella sp. AM30-3LB]|uniref:GntR family transcriptional regulator n=1 Tax=Olsenella sp. AM30-3LB TaxID=2292359 RepID=UPI000E515BA7|nr:GntR family transcriptional regulator [Olsenella sp. AM30-3LB]RHD73626.1 GntR family transcriptional regulator [Olsenella sp. AM30-3LB]